MDFEETMVENIDNNADDTLEEVVEEPQDDSEELVQEAEPAPKQSEPGWIKRRVSDAVEKALAKERANIQAEYDAKYAPLMERMLEMDAQELVRNKKCGDIETARELVRLRNNMPVSTEEPQPRNAQGQYAPKDDPATSARIDMLRHQADRIKGNNGPDVIAEFQNNEEIKQAVISGEMDFYDVADYLNQKSSRRPPSPVRSPNGVSGSLNAIESMSDEQFRKLEKRIEGGARIRLK